MRILYVEDEIWMAKTIEVMLRQAGYAFDTAHCGQEAIDLAEKSAYDLILLDIMLPDFDGYEVIERLRAKNIETPFLVQTGLVDKEQEDAGASLGVTDYLIKPFNKNDLIKGIEAVIARTKPDNPVAVALEAGRASLDNADVAESREHRRFNTLKTGRIVWPSPCSCVVLNMCYGGAAIRLPYPEKELPAKFAMVMDSKDSEVKCEVAWRHGDKVGIKFL